MSINLSIAQNRELTNDSDTVFWFRQRVSLYHELGLETIDKSPHQNEIRFWDGDKVVRVWIEKGEKKGDVIFFLKQYKIKRNKEKKIYVRKFTLDQQTIEHIDHLASDFEIDKIPTDKKIDGWPSGTDGKTFFVESCEEETFSFKNYWSPGTSSKESRSISYFFTLLNSLEFIMKEYKMFIKNQPFNIYYEQIEGIKLNFSSFLSRWYFRVDKALFMEARDRKYFRKQAQKKKNS